MQNPNMAWGLLLALAISILIAAALFYVLKKLAPLVLNGIFGILIFWLLSYFGLIRAPIDLLTFLIAAIGGIFGVLIVLLLTYLGIPL